MAEVIIFVPCPNRAAPSYIVNYGALSIATALKNHGVSVRYIDGSSGSLTDICECIKSEIRNCVYFGVSAFTSQVHEALFISDFVKSIQPRLPIVWGGVHASMLPEETARDKAIDYVCIGEGDYTAVELFDELSAPNPDLNRVHNLIYYKGDEVVRTKIAPFFDMSKQESIAWDLLELEKYVVKSPLQGENMPSLGIPVARGCPHRCSFCINVALKDYGYTQYRRRRPECVENDVIYLKKRINLSYSVIRDEIFFVDTKYSREIARVFYRHGIRWGANVRADYFSPQRITEEYLKEMRALGMSWGSMGIESGSPRLLREIIQKDITIEQVDYAMTVMKKVGIRPFISFMAGFPTETSREAEETIDYAMKLKRMIPDIVVSGIFLLRPYSGAPIYELCRRYGLQEPKSLREWGEMKLTKHGGIPISYMPWLASRKNLYDIVETTGLSLISVNMKLGLKTNVHIIIAKMRRRLGFYGFPIEKRIYSFIKIFSNLFRRIKSKDNDKRMKSTQ